MSTTLSFNSLARLQAGDGISLTGSATATGAAVVSVPSETIALNQTNHEIDIAFTLANVVAVCILSSANVTLKTNSTSLPDDEIALKAGIPLLWIAAAPYAACPITANVTKFYVTTTAATVFQALVLTS